MELPGVNVDPVRDQVVGLRGREGISYRGPEPWTVVSGFPEKTIRAFRDEEHDPGGMVPARPRYILLEPTTDTVKKAEFNSWQATLGIGFGF
jgi:hypothetical protein